MNVEDAISKRFDKARRQQPHVTSKTNQVDSPFSRYLNKLSLMSLTPATLTLHRERFDTAGSSERETRGIRLVTDYDHDLGVRDLPGANRIVKREHV